MRIRSLIVPVIAAGALTVAGCSGSSPSGGASSPPTGSASPSAAACAFDETKDGVTAKQVAGQAPTLTVAANAKAPAKLVVVDLCPGSGTAAQASDVVTVNYTGVGYKTKKEFDSSFKRGEPATFPLQGVIPGWTQGVTGMQPGSARLLLIPPDLAYGPQGRPPVIQQNEALAFIVELVSVQSPSAPTQ